MGDKQYYDFESTGIRGSAVLEVLDVLDCSTGSQIPDQRQPLNAIDKLVISHRASGVRFTTHHSRIPSRRPFRKHGLSINLIKIYVLSNARINFCFCFAKRGFVWPQSEFVASFFFFFLFRFYSEQLVCSFGGTRIRNF